MAAATAATAAGVAQSQAGLVTINLTGNFISATGGNHLNADLTGDGVPDVVIANAFNAITFPQSHTGDYGYAHYVARANLNGISARAFAALYDGLGSLILGSQHNYFGAHVPPSYVISASLTGSIPVSFKDLHINNGALTSGSLEVTVFAKARPEGIASIQLDSLTFNTPDNGSSLGLLAMGAGGVLALRRRRAAEVRS